MSKWLSYPGNIRQMADWTYDDPTPHLINPETSEIIRLKQNGGGYEICPISSAVQKYIFTYADTSTEEFRKISYSDINQPVYSNSNFTKYIWAASPLSSNVFTFYMCDTNSLTQYSNRGLTPGEAPIKGEFTDLSEVTHKYGQTEYAYSVSGISEFGNYNYVHLNYSETNYGAFSIQPPPTGLLSSSTLYGLYSYGDKSRLIGDYIYNFTDPRKPNYFYTYGTWEVKDPSGTSKLLFPFYDPNLSAWNVDNCEIKYNQDYNLYIIGTSGVGKWYTSESLPSSGGITTFYEQGEGSPEGNIVIEFAEFNSFWKKLANSIPLSGLEQIKEKVNYDDFNETILIADPWRWLT